MTHVTTDSISCNTHFMVNIETGTRDNKPPRWIKLTNTLIVADVGFIRVTEDDELGATVEIDIKYSKAHDQYVSTAVTVRSDGDTEVNGALLRDVRVLEIMQQGSKDLVFSVWDPDKVVPAYEVIEEFRPIEGRTTSIIMEQVAFVYRVARVTGNRPLKEVARVFGVSHSTAIRLYARAREENRISA